MYSSEGNGENSHSPGVESVYKLRRSNPRKRVHTYPLVSAIPVVTRRLPQTATWCSCSLRISQPTYTRAHTVLAQTSGRISHLLRQPPNVPSAPDGSHSPRCSHSSMNSISPSPAEFLEPGACCSNAPSQVRGRIPPPVRRVALISSDLVVTERAARGLGGHMYRRSHRRLRTESVGYSLGDQRERGPKLNPCSHSSGSQVHRGRQAAPEGKSLGSDTPAYWCPPPSSLQWVRSVSSRDLGLNLPPRPKKAMRRSFSKIVAGHTSMSTELRRWSESCEA